MEPGLPCCEAGATEDGGTLSRTATDDELEAPPVGKDAPAGWYDRSPTPGEVGPSLIVGHVDSAEDGPAVFFDLGALHRKDTLTVTCDDGSKAPEMRLITCGGDFVGWVPTCQSSTPAQVRAGAITLSISLSTPTSSLWPTNS